MSSESKSETDANKDPASKRAASAEKGAKIESAKREERAKVHAERRAENGKKAKQAAKEERKAAKAKAREEKMAKSKKPAKEEKPVSAKEPKAGKNKDLKKAYAEQSLPAFATTEYKPSTGEEDHYHAGLAGCYPCCGPRCAVACVGMVAALLVCCAYVSDGSCCSYCYWPF